MFGVLFRVSHVLFPAKLGVAGFASHKNIAEVKLTT